MLVINRVLSVVRRRTKVDDSGAVLVTVVVVMFVGFVIAVTIAASVMSTIRSNDDNRDHLDAFVAAESGRDVALKSLKAGCTALDSGGTPIAIGAGGQSYSYTIETTADPGDPSNPGALTGLSASCPSETTTRVVITSTGNGADGAVTQITSVYPWNKFLSTQPGGTMAFFDGQFKTTGSGYVGDLVVRTGDYECNSDAVIQGDLWVVGGADGTDGGNVTLSNGCEVTGSIYAAGTVSTSSNPITIGADIIARGEVSLDSNALTIGGDVYSGTVVDLDPTGSTNGSIGGDVISSGEVIGVEDANVATPEWDDDESDKWDIGGEALETEPQPIFDPTLAAVFGMTTWVDLGTGTSWDAVETNSSCPSNSAIAGLLDDSTGRLVIDFTGCGGGPGRIDIELNAVTLTRDVLFYVPAPYRMNVALKGNVNSSTTPEPQMWFIHADQVVGDSEPACGNGGQVDKFDTNSGLAIDARVLVYTACGLAGTINSDFTGQIYVNDDTRTVNADFTCAPMSWEPALPELSCRIRGEDGAEGELVTTYDIGDMIFQTEN